MFALFRRPATWIVLVVVLALGAGFVVMQNQAKAKQAAAAKLAAAAAPKSPYVAIANGKADVEGGMIQVAARRAGIVREVLVNEGDHVTKGQVLARQEDDDARLAAAQAAAAANQARAQIAALQVQLAAARREHSRLATLAASNFVAAQKLDQAGDTIRQAEANLAYQRAAVATAEAALAEARYNQDLTVIRAPADGRIARRYANPGAGASTLNVSTMFDLEPAAPHIIRAEVSESALPFVAIGQTVQVATESDPTKIYNGKVMREAAVFGARKLQSDDPTERADDRVVEVVVSAEGAPFLIGQRVLVKFMRGASVAALP
ncbi:HlyD family secretion protein [Phenylobacterium aquaticum]|uniref:HlyD family secretion protein n=1 Tax=Phenylobacterium aquaticum TaxID=1763816 RepID=UPI001F5D0C22|nr:HlyD family efflux transporter periplasmic adaptor subunit [Phenylobacterium aquaticum]MCI3133937.1 HlyD family efflux transporter periplasmic adaptor subunit [Phenylobacterium aquaticum]